MLTFGDLDDLLTVSDAGKALWMSIRDPGSFEFEIADSTREALRAVEEGRSLQVTWLHRALPASHPLRRIGLAFSALTGAEWGVVSAFVSAPGQSIPLHLDAYDVLSIQLAGRKRWELYGFGSHYRPGPPDPGDHPPEEHVVGPGDSIYVPKGQIHRVVGEGDEMSLSVAPTFDMPAWPCLLDDLKDELSLDRTF